MTVVADSSPLVILTKLGCFDLLNRLFPRVYISAEVHYEVVMAGAGLPGSSEVSKAGWIEVKGIQNPAGLYSAPRKYGVGPGEMSSILLAKELGANPVLLDDYRARKVAMHGKFVLTDRWRNLSDWLVPITLCHALRSFLIPQLISRYSAAQSAAARRVVFTLRRAESPGRS